MEAEDGIGFDLGPLVGTHKMAMVSGGQTLLKAPRERAKVDCLRIIGLGSSYHT